MSTPDPDPAVVMSSPQSDPVPPPRADTQDLVERLKKLHAHHWYGGFSQPESPAFHDWARDILKDAISDLTALEKALADSRQFAKEEANFNLVRQRKIEELESKLESALTAQQGLPGVAAESEAPYAGDCETTQTRELRAQLAESEKEVERLKESVDSYDDALNYRDWKIGDLQAQLRATEQERDAAVADAKRLAEALSHYKGDFKYTWTHNSGNGRDYATEALAAHHALVATPNKGEK